MSNHWLTPSTRLRGPDDTYVTCPDCGRTRIDKPGELRCRRCVQAKENGKRYYAAWLERVQIECPQCHERILSTYGRKFCSDKCSDAHRAADAIEMAQAFAAELNLGAAAGYLQALYRYLADRDGDECHLCGKRIRLDVQGPKGPSVDHLVPRSKGGTHDLANVALAHRSCNSRKGNRAANEQLRLIG